MVGRWRRLAIVSAAAMLVGASAYAQSSACDDFKAVLAARIESTGVRGYSLEAVPAGAPVPSDAKVIATCESGARKIVYRRWGASRAASGAASAARPAMAPPPAVHPDAQAKRVPAARVERAPQAVPASAPSRAPQPAAQAAAAASVVAMSAEAPLKTPASSASDVAAARPVERAAVQPVPAKSDAAPITEALPARPLREFAAGYWPWIAALLLLPVARWIWRRYFSAYDKDGLPRGPRL